MDVKLHSPTIVARPNFLRFDLLPDSPGAMPRIPAPRQWIREIAWSKTIVGRHDIAAFGVDKAWHLVIGNEAGPLMLRVPPLAVAALWGWPQRYPPYGLKSNVTFGIGEHEVEAWAQPGAACLAEFLAIARSIHADRR